MEPRAAQVRRREKQGRQQEDRPSREGEPSSGGAERPGGVAGGDVLSRGGSCYLPLILQLSWEASKGRPQPLPPNYPAGEIRRKGLSNALPCLSDSFSPQLVIKVASCSLGTLFPVISSGSPLADGLLTPCKNTPPLSPSLPWP